MKIYIFTPNKEALFTQELISRLKEKSEVIFYTDSKPFQEYADFLSDESEKIVVLDPDLFSWNFPKENIDLMKNVKAICLQTTSFSWIDSAYAASKGIPVLNLRGFSQQAVAEYTMLLALGVARKMPLVAQNNYVQDFVAHQGIELKGKTAGIIGLGRIGTSIAHLAKGFGMSATYWSKNSRNEEFEYKDLEQLIKESDVIFIAIARNEETSSLLTDELLKSMKPSAIFVSVAHKVYNHDLVIEMVQNGSLYGYGFEGDNANPVQHKGNIYALPALAWATKESMESNAQMWVDSMISASQGDLKNQVN